MSSSDEIRRREVAQAHRGDVMPGSGQPVTPATFAQTVPLPPRTLAALVYVYHARGLSTRRLASSIGTTHPHVGRIMAGVSRPSVMLAERIGYALDLPPEFTALMMTQSSKVGRKMRHGDEFEGTPAPVGDTPCPIAMAHARALMCAAMMDAGFHDMAREFESTYALHTVAVLPAMGGSMMWSESLLDPWGEFEAAHTTPLLVWAGDPKPPSEDTLADLGEFIASVPYAAVIHCGCHARR